MMSLSSATIARQPFVARPDVSAPGQRPAFASSSEAHTAVGLPLKPASAHAINVPMAAAEQKESPVRLHPSPVGGPACAQ